MTDPTEEPYLTRKEIAEVVKAELGIPLTVWAINLAAKEGRGPTPAARFGNYLLYRRSEAMEWARSLITPVGA